MNSLERLVYMANQIALNFAAIGHDHAVAATADHIAHFWDPRMRAMIFDHVAGGGEGLSAPAHAALVRLHDQGAPPPQTRATSFGDAAASGGSDAG